MAYMGEKRVKGVGMKTRMNEALERYRHRRKANIRTDLKETGWDDVESRSGTIIGLHIQLWK